MFATTLRSRVIVAFALFSVAPGAASAQAFLDERSGVSTAWLDDETAARVQAALD